MESRHFGDEQLRKQPETLENRSATLKEDSLPTVGFSDRLGKPLLRMVSMDLSLHKAALPSNWVAQSSAQMPRWEHLAERGRGAERAGPCTARPRQRAPVAGVGLLDACSAPDDIIGHRPDACQLPRSSGTMRSRID